MNGYPGLNLQGAYKEEDGFDFANNDMDNEGFEKHEIVEADSLLGGLYSDDLRGDEALSFLQFEDVTGQEDSNKRLKANDLGSYVQNAWDQGGMYQQQGRTINSQVNPAYTQAQSVNRAPQPASKRGNYDILSSFFRVYFQPDPNSTILKDIVYLLYWKKILPVVSRNSQQQPASNNMNSTNTPLAKNAVYRKLWSVFKDITTYPEDNKIKGLRLVTSFDKVPPHLEKDVDLLRHYLGTNNVFGFSLEELEREVPFDPPVLNDPRNASVQPPQPNTNNNSRPGEPVLRSSLLSKIDRLEQMSRMLNAEIIEMKNVIKKEMLEMIEKKRKHQNIK